MRPHLRFARAAAPPALALVLSGCLGLGASSADRPEPRPALDAYTLAEARARSLAGCRYDYRVFEPATPPAGAVVIGHGFLRDQDREVGLARALANGGYRAVTLDFCNMRPWNGHHVRNAADMRELAREHGLPGRNVYAGFSAGALAALLAGADDPEALGVVALDLVDQAGLGADAVTRLRVPLLGIAGPPAACNAEGNGRPIFATGGPRPRPGSLDSVAGATHCDFEQPTDWLCELACGESPAVASPGTDAGGAPPTRRERIVARTVELVEQLGNGESAGSRALPAP